MEYMLLAHMPLMVMEVIEPTSRAFTKTLTKFALEGWRVRQLVPSSHGVDYATVLLERAIETSYQNQRSST